MSEFGNLIEPIDTKKEVAKKIGISHDTYSRCKTIRDHATQEDIQELRIGKKAVDQVY